MPNFSQHIITNYGFPTEEQTIFDLESTKNAINKFESFLKSESEINRKSEKCLMYLFIELAQNINKHASNTENILISVKKEKDEKLTCYHLFFLNEISVLNATRINNEFSELNKLNRAEIKQKIKQRIQSEKKGIGLLSIKQKNNTSLSYHIFSYKTKSFLLIKTRIYV